jgi:hypothetical protein
MRDARSTARLDAAANSLDEFVEDAGGFASTSSKCHGPLPPAIDAPTPLAVDGWTSPPAAKNTAVEATAAANTIDDFRRLMANVFRPTEMTLRCGNR